jgi:hypothetical protein
MSFPKILVLLLAALMLGCSAASFAQENNPAEQPPAQQQPVTQNPVQQKAAGPLPVQQQQVNQKPAAQKGTQMKSYQQKMNEAYQKAFNPQNKKPTYPKCPRAGNGIASQTSGHFISHETNSKVNFKDYEGKYKQYMNEVKKINEEQKKLLEEKKK